ncbi:MAG: hypothetical protein JSW34_03525 [Candidatus Zixiibacteriota bacterium]|nr:MAG: hypothetical protein JSW34_03525 [candidate division Zixibacteria bacterium]
MPHPLFQFNERCGELDDVYGIIGRALFMATRFERHCRALGNLVKLKGSAHLMVDDQTLGELCHRMQGRVVFQHVKEFATELNSPLELVQVLYKAKHSRNYIAHELTPDFDHIDKLSPADARRVIIQDLQPHVRNLAVGDCLVLYAACQIRGDDVPDGQELEGYANDVVRWVCGCREE